ncbi:MAG: N-6 DNA methylase, partial [bacterium]
RAVELPLLFDPQAPAIALKPGVAALKACLRLLSATDELFTAPDALGWAYQYWNTEEKDRVRDRVRTVKGAKIEKLDIIPETQLYTEPYMVKFLVQNSLGALWMAMHPESRLCDSWEYFVRDADRPTVSPKPVQMFSFLDPCTGSGHFLLEAFDLLYAMYEEEGELKTPADICEAILTRNLYGIDIDERSIQITALALTMKAKEKASDFLPTWMNLAAANIHPANGPDRLTAFLEKHPEDKPLRNALTTVFESLGHADELGSLLQIEEPVEKELRYLKSLDDEEKTDTDQAVLPLKDFEKSEQQRLPLGTDSYEDWKAGVLDRLKAHFREETASTDLSTRFFGQAAGKGLSLFDFLSRRYDVVATNPPYMGSKNMGPIVKRYVETHFTPGKRDLYAAFILRCLELARPETGRVAMVTQQSWMFLRSFAELRALDEEKLKKAIGFKGILRDTSIETLAHLGEHAFLDSSAAGAFVVLFTLAKKAPAGDHRLTAFRLIGPKSPEEKELLLRISVFKDNQTSLVSNPKQKHFVNIPLSPIGYWLRDNFYKVFKNKTIGDISKIVQQIITADNKRFLRYAWEITNLNKNWLGYLKSGGYARWSGYEKMLINWRANGETIKLAILEKYQYLKGNWGWLIKEETFFKTGWTYTLMARGCFGVRQLSSNFICDSVSPAIIPHEECLGLSSILNSRIISYLLRSTTSEIKFRENYVARMPLPRHVNMVTLSKTELSCIAHKNIIIK